LQIQVHIDELVIAKWWRDVHCVPKNVTTLSRYNSDIHESCYWESRQSKDSLFFFCTTWRNEERQT